MRSRKQLPLEQLRPYELELPRASRLDFAAAFGSAAPVELEIGFGKGAFLIAAAETNPQHHFVGIEIDLGLQRYVATRIAKRQLANAKVLHGDALPFLRDHVAEATLAAIHIYCPDPWWKKRHHKRRLFTEPFVRELERTLQPGGRLLIGTDVAAYFVLMLQLLSAAPRLLPEPVPPPATATNFEVKATRKGKRIWRGAYRKVA